MAHHAFANSIGAAAILVLASSSGAGTLYVANNGVDQADAGPKPA